MVESEQTENFLHQRFEERMRNIEGRAASILVIRPIKALREVTALQRELRELNKELNDLITHHQKLQDSVNERNRGQEGFFAKIGNQMNGLIAACGTYIARARFTNTNSLVDSKATYALAILAIYNSLLSIVLSVVLALA